MGLPERDDVVAYLNSRLTNLGNEINQGDFTDAVTGWKLDIDFAEQRIGDGTFALAFYALAEYYALDRITSALATRVDTEAYVEEGDRQTVYDRAAALRNHAARKCGMYGYPVVSNEIGLVAEDDEAAQGGMSIDQLRLNNFFTPAAGDSY
jgi:hypothetical protein